MHGAGIWKAETLTVAIRGSHAPQRATGIMRVIQILEEPPAICHVQTVLVHAQMPPRITIIQMVS